MTITVDVDISAQKILAARGLDKSGKAVLFLANEVKRFCEPYVPMQQGTLKNSRVIQKGNGAEVLYNTPYAHYQYHGIVMAGRAPKHYTGKALQYHGGGMRGKEWDKRMMADHKGNLVSSFANYVGGAPG